MVGQRQRRIHRETEAERKVSQREREKKIEVFRKQRDTEIMIYTGGEREKEKELYKVRERFAENKNER